ncbi:MAG: ComEA family DNA-binding protein [Gemmatimonadaceae bacterium]
MPTPAERQALLFLAAVLALGTGGRVARSGAAEETPAARASARAALVDQLAAVDSALAPRGRRGPRPGAPVVPSSPRPTDRPADPPTARRLGDRPSTAPIDLDTAPESVLVTLPGIGPALARRIALDRERHGTFGSLTALTRVAGIGERSAARLAPHVTFSGGLRRPR